MPSPLTTEEREKLRGLWVRHVSLDALLDENTAQAARIGELEKALRKIASYTRANYIGAADRLIATARAALEPTEDQ